jgi:hypothetical protein
MCTGNVSFSRVIATEKRNMTLLEKFMGVRVETENVILCYPR